MAFSIKRWFARHDSGTKFYQVFLIESDHSDRAFVVTSWESYSLGSEHLPIHFGASRRGIKNIPKGQGEWEASNARSRKQARGYPFEPATLMTHSRADDFASDVRRMFRSADADQIIATMTAGAPESLTEEEREYVESLKATPDPETVKPEAKKEEPPKRGDEWGSW